MNVRTTIIDPESREGSVTLCGPVGKQHALSAAALLELRIIGDQQPQVAQILASRPGHHRVAQRGEHRTGIECAPAIPSGEIRRRGRVPRWSGRRWPRPICVLPSMPSEPALNTVSRSPG